MRGGVILIALGLLIGYLGVTGRYKCFSLFISCLSSPELADGFSLGGGSGSGASGGKIEVTPRNTGDNPLGVPVYDARDPAPIPFLPPIDYFV